MASEETRQAPGNLILAGIPTKNGMFSAAFLASVQGLQTPINTSLGWSYVIGKPVDEAREQLVEAAKAMKAKYLLFIDDDTLLPPFAISRLLNLQTKVASGIYYTKSQPPEPIILMKNHPGGYRNWQYGDVFTVDYTGLGCCLIDMSIFDEMEPPYFFYKKGMTGPDDNGACIGEDVYFCQKVADAGHKVWVDSVVQCQHEDFPSKTFYFYHQPTRTGAWRGTDGIIYFIPPAEHESRVDPTVGARIGGKVCFGYGTAQLKGYEEANEVDDGKLREKYKDVEEIRVRNVLEYGTTEKSLSLLVSMYGIMKDGGKLYVEVPNVVPYIKTIDDASDVKHVQAIYGWGEGKYRSAYTKKCIEELVSAAGFKVLSVSEGESKLVLEGVK